VTERQDSGNITFISRLNALNYTKLRD